MSEHTLLPFFYTAQLYQRTFLHTAQYVPLTFSYESVIITQKMDFANNRHVNTATDLHRTKLLNE